LYQWWSNLPPWQRFVALLVAVASPLGAPAVALAIVGVSGADWDEPIYNPPSPLLDYFMAFLFGPYVWLGSVLGLAWTAMSVLLVFALVWTMIGDAVRYLADRI